MVTQKNILFFVLIVISFGITSCHDSLWEEKTMNSPVYMTYEDLRSAVKVTPSQTLQKPGKLYFKDNLIFINEELKGVHVVDNENPKSPEFIAFIEIPGNVDMAVRNNTLFVDSYIDLVAIDITDPADPKEIGRLENAFPYILPPVVEDYIINNEELDEKKGIVISWKVEKILKEIKPDQHWISPYPFLRENGLFFDYSATKTSSGGGGGSSFGVGGSMARFTLYDKYLYSVDDRELKIFKVLYPDKMFKENSVHLGWRGVETIFQYNKKLFFGTQTGMLIYDLSNPVSPEKISEFNHIASCDPVVVEGDIAYVTLRTGNACNRGVNQLDILDLSNIYSPQLLKSYPMTNPHGLGIDNDTLFICDGSDGLEVYNSADPYNLKLITHFPDIKAWDVIPVNGLLLLIGEDGFYQYDYSGQDDIYLVSSIPVENP